jgi:hypothetical protein
MSRGLLATCYATLRDGVGADEIQDALVEAYDDEPFVHVLEPGTFPHTKALAGSNGCQLSAIVDPRTGRVTVTSRDRQPRQGGRWAGPAEREPHARRGDDPRAHGDRGVPVIAGWGPADRSGLTPILGGVTAAQGFRAGGVASGVKPSGKPDLALVVADAPAPAPW